MRESQKLLDLFLVILLSSRWQQCNWSLFRKIWIDLPSPRDVFLLTIFVSLSPIFPTYLSFFIYRLHLVGSSWWDGYSPYWWAPLSYILDQMGPATRDWCPSWNLHQAPIDNRWADSPSHYLCSWCNRRYSVRPWARTRLV